MMDEKKLLRDAACLAKHACANYDDGYCFMDDQFCKVILPGYSIHEGAINCEYFLDAVLPLDKELHDAVMTCLHRDEYAPWMEADDQQEAVLKQCASCGKAFTPKSNRQRYCSVCAVEAKRKRDAKAARHGYWQKRA